MNVFSVVEVFAVMAQDTKASADCLKIFLTCNLGQQNSRQVL